jgi:hypothetical protein|tara:strand:- start:22 stop:246 length:225 start_codon:yes stop_codon:yes gene_type:complete
VIWANLLSGVLSLANWFARKFERDEYREQGRRDAVLEQVREIERTRHEAKIARANTADIRDRGLLANDPANRRD